MANELTVVNEKERAILLSVVGGKLAQEIEFTQLDNAIEKIAAHTTALTDGERESAATLIDKFETRVVDAIAEKRQTLYDFAANFRLETNAPYYKITDALDEYGPQIHAVLASQELSELDEALTAIEKKIEEIHDYELEKEPEKPFIDEDVMTRIEVNEINMEYNMNKAKFKNAVHMLEYGVRSKFHDFMVALRKDKKIKRFLKILDEQAKNAQRAEGIVEEKAEAAKMAIMISDGDIRAALQDFHDFASTL